MCISMLADNVGPLWYVHLHPNNIIKVNPDKFQQKGWKKITIKSREQTAIMYDLYFYNKKDMMYYINNKRL